MLNGSWKIKFETILGQGDGIVTFQGGKIFGGDSGFYYFGEYWHISSHEYKSLVYIYRYVPGFIGVFGESSEIEAQFEGTAYENKLKFNGISIVENIKISLTGEKLII